MKCVNKSCTVNKQHCREIKQFHDSIISSCVEAGKQCIAHTSRPSKTRGLPGWNEIVKPYRDDSLFWHSVWRQCGSPRDAVVADVMRRARSQYHNAVRLLRRDQLNTQKDRAAQALLADHKINFWKEIRKMKGKNDTLLIVDDGISKEGDISELFASQYDDLYNSVSYDSESMVILSNRLDRLIHDTANVGNHINVNDVKRGIDQLKPNKKDGYGTLYTDHFINSNNMMRVYLALLFDSMVVHGFTPDGFNEATIFPLVKNKRKSVNDSSNYRAIALSSPLAKLFDKIILQTHGDIFRTDDLQYGFKEHSSTTKCTFSLMETVNYFRKNNSNVYIMLLDATKAFDKVNYVKLFHQLIDRGLNPLVIRCLLYM